MDSRVQKKTGGASCEGAPSSKYGFPGERTHVGSTLWSSGTIVPSRKSGRAAPKVPLGEARQEERDEWQRSSHGQGREIRALLADLRSLNGKHVLFFPWNRGPGGLSF